MYFVLKPSLEHMALVKIVISLWNQNDVWALIAKLSFQPNSWNTDDKCEIIQERVIEKVPQLSLPQLLDEKVLSFIKPIGLQILEWVKFHCTYYLHIDLPAELYWTPHGTIDRKKTAQVLVKDESLDISTRYKLACLNCLEDDIIELWNNMSKYLKQSFYKNSPNNANWDQKWLIFIWSCYMKRRRVAHTSYKDAFNRCAHRGNKVAADYFLQKLTQRERKESLVETAERVRNTEVFCFLLSEMEEDQQMEVFKNNPYRVLYCFLQWPWQSFFIRVANCMWDSLSAYCYNEILVDIIDKIKYGYKDCNYKLLFREFWQKSPNALKSFIIGEFDKCLLLPSLFDIKDKEKIRLILMDATLRAKEKLMNSDRINYFLHRFIRDNEWDFLEFCIRECFPSKNKMLKFKEKFEKRVMWNNVRDKLARNSDKWDQLFRFSGDSICEYDKRSAEEDESSSSKRSRNLQ